MSASGLLWRFECQVFIGKCSWDQHVSGSKGQTGHEEMLVFSWFPQGALKRGGPWRKVPPCPEGKGWRQQAPESTAQCLQGVFGTRGAQARNQENIPVFPVSVCFSLPHLRVLRVTLISNTTVSLPLRNPLHLCQSYLSNILLISSHPQIHCCEVLCRSLWQGCP